MAQKSVYSAAYDLEYERLRAAGVDISAAMKRAAEAGREAEEERRQRRRVLNARYQQTFRDKRRVQRLQQAATISVKLPLDLLEALDLEVQQVHSDLPREKGRALLIAALVAPLKEKHRQTNL